MKRVLILGCAPDASGNAWTLPPDCVLISASPAVSELLAETERRYTEAIDYVAGGWDAIHERIDRAARWSDRAPWLDDWSHLIADTVRVDFFWAEVARRIVEVERPAVVLVQRPIESHPCGESLGTIAAALELLGAAFEWFEWWTQSRGE